jgi:hypothetical protein
MLKLYMYSLCLFSLNIFPCFHLSHHLKYLDNKDFNTETLMDFYLTIERKSSFAVLGDLRLCRVVVLNEDTFPNGVTDMSDDQTVRVHN